MFYREEKKSKKKKPQGEGGGGKNLSWDKSASCKFCEYSLLIG